MIKKIKEELKGHSQFFHASFLSSFSSVVKILASFVIGKCIAIFVGPSGFAIMGQFNNFLSVLHAVGSGGVNLGLTTQISVHENDKISSVKYIQSTFFLMLLCTAASGVIILIYPKTISQFLFGDQTYFRYLILLGLAMFFHNTGQLILAILNGFKAFRQLAIVHTLASIIHLCLSVGFIYLFKVDGVVISVILLLFLYFFVSLYVLKRHFWINNEMFWPRFHQSEVKRLMSFTLMFIFSASIIPTVQLLLRSELIEQYSRYNAGLWEAILRISQFPVLILTTAFSTYYLPHLARIETAKVMRQEVYKTVRLIVPLSAAILLGLYLVRNIFIQLFFNSDFLSISDMLLFQLIGDFFRLLSFVFAYVLLAKTQTKMFIIAELCYGLLFYLSSHFLMQQFGLVGICYGYCLSYFTYLCLVIVFYRLSNWYA